MFGSWKGSENDNQRKGLVKYWIQHRFEDGTFLLFYSQLLKMVRSKVLLKKDNGGLKMVSFTSCILILEKQMFIHILLLIKTT